jgi:hypothetical protein
MIPAGTWRIRVPPDRLPALRGDAAFRQVLGLGRFLNSVRFCQFAMLEWRHLDSPAGQRQRSAVFLIAAGLLHEGLQLLQRMGKHFRHYPSWATKLQPILSDRAVEQLLRESIIPVRDKTVFHFGEDAFIEPLADLDHDVLVLASGAGPEKGEVSYELSDLLAHHLFIGGPAATPEEHLQGARDLMQRTVDLMGQIAIAGEALIRDYSTANSFIHEVQNPDGTWRAA